MADNKVSKDIILGDVQTGKSSDVNNREHIVYGLTGGFDAQSIIYIEEIYEEYLKINNQNSVVKSFVISLNSKYLSFDTDSDKEKEGFAIVKQWIEKANKKRADFEAELLNLNS